MNKRYYGSINFDALVQGIKNGQVATHVTERGKRYVNISVWVNDEPDQYGNEGSLQLVNKKEFMDEKKIYIGNIRENKADRIRFSSDVTSETDDLPF